MVLDREQHCPKCRPNSMGWK